METDLITDEALMEGFASLDRDLQSFVDRVHELMVRVEERVTSEHAHECPGDHHVYDSLHQARARGAECLMWLRNAAAAKLNAATLPDNEPPN